MAIIYDLSGFVSSCLRLQGQLMGVTPKDSFRQSLVKFGVNPNHGFFVAIFCFVF